MSTRWYPLFQPGNPQLRVFLPNFWMKVIRPFGIDDPRTVPSNRVNFIVSMEMTKYDIRNYLKKIYDVDAVHVATQIRSGKTNEVSIDQSSKMIAKDDDYKVAFVTLPKGQTFTFPEIYAKDKFDAKSTEDKKQVKEFKASHKTLQEATKVKPDLPGWFAS